MTPTRPRPRIYDPGWTPRQRQVLELLVRGRTNAQIGRELGITLDGAKWHVTEVITKLGVDSREEAAEYWRQYNGLPARLNRVFAGVASMAGLKWAATAVSLVVVGVAVAGAITMVANSRRGEGDAEAPADVGSVPTDAAVTPGDVAGPNPALAPDLQGGSLTLAQAAALPANMAFYYYNAPFASNAGYDGRILRAYKDAAGVVQKADVFAFFAAQGARPHTYAFDSRMGELVAAVCQQPPACTQVGPAQGSVKATVYRSLDGGVTWAQYGEVPGNSSLLAVLPNGVLRSNLVQEANGAQSVRYTLFPSGTEVLPPGGDYALFPSQVPGLGLAWRNAEGVVYDAAGKEVVRLAFEAGIAAPRLLGYASGQMTASWVRDNQVVVGIFGSDGALKTSFTWGLAQALQPVGLATPTTIAGSVMTEPGAQKIQAAIIDLANLAVRPLPDLAGDQSSFVLATVAGTFLRVAGAGDCLNVREEPAASSAVLACYADTVLLRDLGKVREVEGKTWLSVETPTGRPGWAVADFLAK